MQKTVKKSSDDYTLEDLLAEHQKDIIDVSFTDWIPTGIPQVDLVTGGGQPAGKIIEIYGPESSGKTTLALLFAKQVIQNNNQKVVYIDMEHSINIDWANKMIGIDINEENKKNLVERRFLLAQPDSMEEGLNLAEDVQRVQDNSIGLIVFDSVAAGSPEKELEGGMEDNTIGLQAKLMSQAMRKLKGRLNKNKIQAVFINQERDRINVMFGGKTTTGGHALKYYSQIRIRISKTETLEKNGKSYAIISKIETRKNKLYPPFKTHQIQVSFDKGLDEFENILNFAIETGIITRKGSYFYIDVDNNISYQGRQNLEKGLIENPEQFEFVKEKSYELVKQILENNTINVMEVGSPNEQE